MAAAGVEEGGSGVDEHAGLQRLAADEHAKAHALAIGQSDFDGPAAVAEVDVGRNDVAQFGIAVGTRYHALILDLGCAVDFDGRAARHRVDLEADVFDPISSERFDGAGVKCAGPGASVDFYFERGKAEEGQPNPFLPTENKVWCCLIHKPPVLITWLCSPNRLRAAFQPSGLWRGYGWA